MTTLTCPCCMGPLFLDLSNEPGCFWLVCSYCRDTAPERPSEAVSAQDDPEPVEPEKPPLSNRVSLRTDHLEPKSPGGWIQLEIWQHEVEP